MSWTDSTNIDSNAIKFTTEGSVTLSISTVQEDAEAKDTTVMTRSTRQGLSRTCSSQTTILNFAVTDTGAGIESNAIPRLFNAFVQEDNSTARKYGGTGLGLNISKQLVELMGGQINLSSKIAKGTTVSFQIPFTFSDAVSSVQSKDTIVGE